MKNISKTNIHIGIQAYLLQLNREEGKALSKRDQEWVRGVLRNSLNMLLSLKEPVGHNDLNTALANLLAYIVSNGKEDYVEKVRHLSDIISKTNLILEMTEQTPLAEVLDYIHGKKKHPLTNILKKQLKH